ncbi:hypothetical protein AWH49_13395 [Domibacillus aminovorans]|uniref:Uncharacterized protein n=1 Tax=Domibacillus aminovorans TaxID=29332 RepID=A0A177L745_9BACI|nr:hypothetical protein AWH49_13395 [Domibacillus aminovorans]
MEVFFIKTKKKELFDINVDVRKLAAENDKDLLLVAFSYVIIKCSNASFNHHSMSFKDGEQPSFKRDV